MTSMRDTVYLIFNQTSVVRSVGNIERATLGRGEYYAKVNVTVPNEFFAKRPVPVVDIELPAPFVNEPPVSIDPEKYGGGADETSAMLSLSIKMFGRILEKARQSKDREMRDLANQTFNELVEQGIDVRLADASHSEESSA